MNAHYWISASNISNSFWLSVQIFRLNGRELQVLPVMELTYSAHSHRDDPLADADLQCFFQNVHIRRVKIKRLLSQWLDSWA